jgi:hypothetical protein
VNYKAVSKPSDPKKTPKYTPVSSTVRTEMMDLSFNSSIDPKGHANFMVFMPEEKRCVFILLPDDQLLEFAKGLNNMARVIIDNLENKAGCNA